MRFDGTLTLLNINYGDRIIGKMPFDCAQGDRIIGKIASTISKMNKTIDNTIYYTLSIELLLA